MSEIPDTDYLSPADAVKSAPVFPSLAFYRRVAPIVFAASGLAKRGRFGDNEWARSSLQVRRAFESCGARVRVQGTANIAAAGGPCVYIGNHMSTAETFLLGAVLLPFGRVTFVVKRALVEYPIFKHIMLSREPIVVGRENPREDLKAVLEGGIERLRAGISVVIFPQRTRKVAFDRSEFNTIGVKLARRAGVPVVPLALKTDAWSNGKRLKDFGPFVPGRDVEFAFGKVVDPHIGDRAVHAAVIAFIETHLRQWGVPVATF
jgi:1-acyl-sn-glycerol-3-phosphate acyltransferase